MLTMLGLWYGRDGSPGMGTFHSYTLAIRFLNTEGHDGPCSPTEDI